MSTALNQLVSRYETRVAALTDTDARLEAAWALETFRGAATCWEQATERGPVQYSISGRAFSFESKAAAKMAMESAKADLQSSLSADGGTTFVDGGGRIW